MNNRLRALIIVVLHLSACATEPGETTAIGAATGGFLGAGLGAIIGSQTGDGGAGLAIGTLAGSMAGGLIGNEVESKEKEVALRDELVRRREETLRSQSKALKELERLDARDTPTDVYSNPERVDLAEVYSDADSSVPPKASYRETKSYETKKVVSKPVSKEVSKRVVTTPAKRVVRTTEVDPEAEEVKALGLSRVTSASATKSESRISESKSKEEVKIENTARQTVSATGGAACSAAANAEAVRAASADSVPDRLFYLRRALRICPTSAEYHVKLGDAYLAANRRDDALFEYQEALKLQPGYPSALSKVKELE